MAVDGSAADVVFRTQVLRSFLNHPGVGRQQQGFLKPSHPAHRPAATCHPSLLLPFDSAEEEERAARRWRRRAEEGRGEVAPGGAYMGQGHSWRRAVCPRRPLSSPKQRHWPELAWQAAGRREVASGRGLRGEAEERGGMCVGTPDAASGTSPSAGSGTDPRRRRPVCAALPDDLEDVDDPSLLSFPEEPDDPRVYLPAHRIGDLLPEGPLPGAPALLAFWGRGGGGRLPAGSRKAKQSRLSASSPALLLGGQKLPMHRAAVGRRGHCGDAYGLGSGGPSGSVGDPFGVRYVDSPGSN